MKRMLFTVLAMALVLTGCSTTQTNDAQAVNTGLNTSEEIASESQAEPTDGSADGEILEIREKLFLTQINDIYLNIDNYKDKTIKVEGMYGILASYDSEEEYSVVYRNGPGCCGNDGWGGFFLNYDGELPEENDWIEVIGTPELVQDGTYTDLYLNVTSLQIKEERGAEFVEQ